MRGSTFALVGLPLVGLTLVAAGCVKQPSDSGQERSTPFVFQALNLRQQDPQGRLLWRASAPEARYDLSRRIAQSSQLQGEIFTNGRPLYRLKASHGTVLGDGQVLQLEGDVRVERLGAEPVTIRAARMRWYPRQQRLELDRQAQAQTPQLRLLADRATLWFDRDRLELRGNPELQQRDLRLMLRQLIWSPGSGELQAPGPAIATSRGASGANRRLSASGLSGNTVSKLLTLQAPVTLEAPDQQAWLKAQSSVVNLVTNQITSTLPFQAGLKTLAIQGGGFQLGLDQQLASITSGCQLRQPGASLRAGFCRWNWRTQTVQASGGVTLERPANQQITRAKSLNGSIAANGELVFSSPGSRVQSRFRLPARRSQGAPTTPAIRL